MACACLRLNVYADPYPFMVIGMAYSWLYRFPTVGFKTKRAIPVGPVWTSPNLNEKIVMITIHQDRKNDHQLIPPLIDPNSKYM